jgi:hypothetical protein
VLEELTALDAVDLDGRNRHVLAGWGDAHSAKEMTVHLLREQQALPSGWPLEREAPGLAHRLHRFLDSE